MVSREGRMREASNADDMRAMVGEIVCGSESRSPARWPAMVVETAHPTSWDRRAEGWELPVGNDIWRGPRGFLVDRPWKPVPLTQSETRCCVERYWWYLAWNSNWSTSVIMTLTRLWGVVKRTFKTRDISKLLHTLSTRFGSAAANHRIVNPYLQVFLGMNENLVQSAWSTCWSSVDVW